MFSHLREDLQCIRQRDPAARSTFSILTCYPGLHALVIHRLANACWRRKWTWLARWLSHWGRFLTGIEIHPAANIGRRVFIDHGMGVVIGETAEVGEDCTIYQGVTLGGTSLNGGKRHPTLGRGVVVGAGAKILGPFRVGDNARIGSNAVVVREVPPGATAVGIPARVIVEDDAKIREAQALKLGFSAYAVSKDLDDPLTIALHSLIDHSADQARKIDAILVALEQLGARPEGCGHGEFNAERLNELIDL